PELNPVEYLWSYLKLNPLANWAPHDVDELAVRLDAILNDLHGQQQLLRSFVRASPLSFCFD
ncbi:MAG: hypothetical protein JSV80_08035, partial [Acidobacteriota bacterium]